MQRSKLLVMYPRFLFKDAPLAYIKLDRRSKTFEFLKIKLGLASGAIILPIVWRYENPAVQLHPLVQSVPSS